MFEILIWGVGDACNKVEKIINYEEVNVIGYIDNNKEKQEKLKNNKPIISPNRINEFQYQYIFIASQYYKEIHNQLLLLGVKDSKIVNPLKLIQDIIDIEYIKCDKKYLYNKLVKNYFSAKNSTDVNTIITGISYAECGINLDLLKYKAVNLALSGQDLYYDYNIAKNIIELGKNKIKNVIIGLCYYSFQYDLSLSVGKTRCIYVYKNILNLVHNYNKHMDTKFKLLDYFDNSIIANSSLFLSNSDVILQKLNINFEVNFDKNWRNNFDNLCLDDKEKQGKELAMLDSNKNYSDTVKENNKILNEYLQYLNNKGLNTMIIVFPVTQYYSNYFDKRLKDEFYKIINALNQKYKFKFLDYFNSNEFSNSDFSDCSHLNIYGAEKFTNIINKHRFC